MSEPSAAAPKKRYAPRVRPQHRETRDLGLKSLRCFPEIHAKLLQGWEAPELAQWVQQDQREATDISELALRRRIETYRATIPPAQLASVLRSRPVAAAMQKVREGLNELAELENLYRLQMRRIGIDVELEKSMGMLRPTVTQEIRTAREILSTIAELKMDLGLNDRHLGTMEVDAQLTAHVGAVYGNNAKLNAVLANPERRQRLLGVAATLMKSAGADVVEAQGEAVEDAETPPAGEEEVEA